MHRQYVLVDYHSVDNARLPVGVLARKGNESRHNFIHFFFLFFLRMFQVLSMQMPGLGQKQQIFENTLFPHEFVWYLSMW